MKELTVCELFDLSHTIAKPLLSSIIYPWEALPKIKDFIIEIGKNLPADEYSSPSEGVWIAKDASVAPSAVINPPCIIGKGAEIRQCAFIRGSAIVGDGAVVGNSCELKNCILFDKVQVPHFNYVGDSILGFKSHMGAGAITSNVKSDKTLVTISAGSEKIPTGLKKVGAILGDCVEVGCNSVLNPGTVIGKNSNVYPLSSVRGYVPQGHIFKSPEHIVIKKE
jgi:NDP-sugar pyrophosphorylase family protein